jgi:glycine hydroxymethyltransferase
MSADHEMTRLLAREISRQHTTLSMIASENLISDQILQALGSGIVNKTVEGFPGARFHAGCEMVDQIEALAIERAKRLFNAQYANVQAHSGTQANQAALSVLAKPGDRILSLALRDGGHLSHGAKFNSSGVHYSPHHYYVDPVTDLVDMDMVRELARQIRPQVIIVGASSYPRDFDYAAFAAIALEVDARLMVDIAHFSGLVASGLLNDPVRHADIVTMSTYKGLRGPRGGLLLARSDEVDRAINRGIFPFTQGTPAMNAIAAKAVCFHEAALPAFADYCREAVAAGKLLAGLLMEQGIRLITGGTDTSMVLIDLRHAPVDGNTVTARLEQIGILANRNLVPRDSRNASQTSGVRLSTAGLMSRGVPMAAIAAIADIIVACTHAPSEAFMAQAQRQVQALCERWPLSERGARLH